MSPENEVFRFGELELDVAGYQLWRRGRKVRLARKPMDLLILLIERRGQLVSHADIREHIWPGGVNVAFETAIPTAIGEIRRKLHDSAKAPRFIETVPGKGYRFIAEVEAGSKSSARLSPPPIPKVRRRPSPNREPEAGAIADSISALHGGSEGVSDLDGNERYLQGLLQTYRWRTVVLAILLALQFFLVVVGLWMIIAGVNNPTLKGLSLSTLLCFVIPSALLYLWLHFGFILDNVIEDRAKGWRLLSEIGATTRASAFNEGTFVDGWFMCFRPTEHSIDPEFRSGSMFLFVVFYCPLFATAHACILRLFFLAGRPFATELNPSWLGVATRPLPVAAFLVLVLSHAQFRIGGRNPNWMQPVVAVLTLILLYLLSLR